MNNKEIKAFISGTHNLIQDDLIPDDAASDSLGWLTRDGRISLMYGRATVGGDGDAGKSYLEHTAYKADGTAVWHIHPYAVIKFETSCANSSHSKQRNFVRNNSVSYGFSVNNIYVVLLWVRKY